MFPSLSISIACPLPVPPAGGVTIFPVKLDVLSPPNALFNVIGMFRCVPPEGVTSALTAWPGFGGSSCTWYVLLADCGFAVGGVYVTVPGKPAPKLNVSELADWLPVVWI
jgi:hypothetical protein